MKNALISVFDKTNIIKLAKGLLKNNIKIFATKNTEKFLTKENIPVQNISTITKYEEILDGKIKTIHPKIFAGILGNENDDFQTIHKYNIIIFDLIIINFYPLNKNIYNQDLEYNIDIGGPAIVRAAAKNYKNTTIITDILDYDSILKEINTFGKINIYKRMKFAKKAFEYTTNYDFKIFQYFNKKINQYKNKNNIFPPTLYIKYKKKYHLKYGENPHQKAALYIQEKKKILGSIDSMKQIHGVKLSYNNLYDAHIAYECVKQFKKPACVIVKHGTPCGASIHKNLKLAYTSAYHCDSISAFGGIIGFNKIINTEILSTILKNQFVELIIGPEITKNAINIIKTFPKIKLLTCDYNNKENYNIQEIKSMNYSLLVQQTNITSEYDKNWIIVSKKKPTTLEKKYANFCWNIAKFVKSNAIVYSHKFHTVGIGSGQTNRLESVKIANNQYQKNKNFFSLQDKKIIIASDAFFPFRDGIDECIKNKKVSCIIQPGGSIKDQEIINVINQQNISMIFTNNRNFKH